MSFPPRPLQAAQASHCDGMELAPALRAVWGELPDDATIEKLRGELSPRSYYRIASKSKRPASLMVMRLPEADVQSFRAGTLPFVDVQQHLAQLVIAVPAIYLDRTPQGFLLLEDLGDESFEARLANTPREGWYPLYAQAIELLATLHDRAATKTPCIAYSRSFDEKLLRWELEHFREWGLLACGVTLSALEAKLLDETFTRLVNELLALPQGFTHRDYQSRNLMWSPAGRLTLIDFQDALLGPLGYDLAALLCDSYVTLDGELQLALLAHYARCRQLDLSALVRAFRLVSVQRKLKDAGRFVFIDQVRGNPHYLGWYGSSINYAARALGQLPEYAELYALLAHKLAGFPDSVPTPRAQTGSRVPGI